MSNLELFQPLLELSVAIAQCKRELNDSPGWQRKSKLKKQIKVGEKKLSEQSVTLVNSTLDSWDSVQPLAEFLTNELDIIKQESDGSPSVSVDGL